MKSNVITSIVLPVTGLFVVLALALGCDIWVQTLRTMNSRTFSLGASLFLSYSFTSLLVAGGLLSLFWILVTKSGRNIGAGVLYLVVGLFIVFNVSLYFLLPALDKLHFLFIPDLLQPPSYMFITGGFVAVTGLILMLLPKKELA